MVTNAEVIAYSKHGGYIHTYMLTFNFRWSQSLYNSQIYVKRQRKGAASGYIWKLVRS